jgi:hypothetical protein
VGNAVKILGKIGVLQEIGRMNYHALLILLFILFCFVLLPYQISVSTETPSTNNEVFIYKLLSLYCT